MKKIQSQLLIFEAIVRELNLLYRKYTYTEEELETLSKPYSIEEIDQTKDTIDTYIFIMIIETILNGAIPQDKTIYNIIETFSYSLNLPELVGIDKYTKFQTKVKQTFMI